MEFLYPAFLFALFAISVPIIIHLFNFRRFKRVYFTNVRFLKEIKEQTQSKSQLKHLLILLTRILAIVFLCFGFSQPYIPTDQQDNKTGKKYVSIYIDNSFSMNAQNEKGQLIQQAKQIAHEIASAYQVTDEFQLLTNDFEGRQQRWYNREGFDGLVDEVESSPAVKLISEVISRQKTAFLQAKSNNQTIYLISDFQRSSADILALSNDSSLNIKLVPISAQQLGNVYIDSCWFDSPIRQLNQPDKINLRIVNKSEKDFVSAEMKLVINEQQKALGSFAVEARSYIDTALHFTITQTGIQHAVISISDYPIVFDNQYYFSFHIANQINALCINATDTNKRLSSLFAQDDYINLKQVFETSLDYSKLDEQDVIFLSELNSISSGLQEEIIKFTKMGGTTVVIPSLELNVPSYNQLLSQFGTDAIGTLDTNATLNSTITLEHELFKNVFTTIPDNIDLPKVNAHYPINITTRSLAEVLLTLENGHPFLTRYSIGKGSLMLFSVALQDESSNFHRHAIFVPIMHKILILSQITEALAYDIGENNLINTSYKSNNEAIFHLQTTDQSFDIIPETRAIRNTTALFLHGQVKQAGNYNLTLKDTVISGVAFNFNRNESDLELYSQQELSELCKNSGLSTTKVFNYNQEAGFNQFNKISEGIKLWKYCILLVLVFLGLEILLLKFWK